MATNYTTNYELSQWLSTDQVLRTDFNADNAKLDATLAGKAEAEALRKAEETAAGRREAILAEAAKDCQALKDAALGRMDQAAQAILERVVES